MTTIMTTQANKNQDKYVVVVDRVVVGRHGTKSAAHADGMARRRNGEAAFTYLADVYAQFIAAK